MKSLPIFQIDAFTKVPFKGNPAGVCITDSALDKNLMQNVAAEMNLSETAFLTKEEGYFSIRYFTPKTEVPLCGHATLASAHLLWERGIVPKGETIHLKAKGGDLKADLEDDWIRLDFPAFKVEKVDVPLKITQLLDAKPIEARKGALRGYLLELENAQTVRELYPDFAGLKRKGYGGIIVTAPSDDERYDFISRFFAPDVGIDEDPVTGVAHCCLGPYWAEKLGKPELIGYQASKRGGVVKVRVKGERVNILGQACTVLKGEISLP